MKYDLALYRATVRFSANRATFVVSAYNMDYARKFVGLEFAAAVWADRPAKPKDGFGRQLIEYGMAAHAFTGGRDQIAFELERVLKGAFGDVQVTVEQVK